MSFNYLNGKCQLIFVLILSLITISGCLVIPLKKEIDSEEIMGQRVDEQGNITAEILKRNVRQNIFGVIGPEGIFVKDYLIFQKYYYKEDGHIKYIPYLKSFWDTNSYDINVPIYPIEGTSTWLAIKICEIKSRYAADVYSIIFDQNKIHHKLLINDCRRIDGYYGIDIDYLDGYRKVIFHTYSGDVVLNTISGKFE